MSFCHSEYIKGKEPPSVVITFELIKYSIIDEATDLAHWSDLMHSDVLNVYSCACVAAAKEQNKHDHADQSTAFLAAARHKPAFGVSDLEPKFKVNGSHVPGCGGGCAVAVNGGSGCGISFDTPSSALLQHRNTAGLKKVLNMASLS